MVKAIDVELYGLTDWITKWNYLLYFILLGVTFCVIECLMFYLFGLCFSCLIHFIIAAFLIFLIVFPGLSYCSHLICMYVELLYYQVYFSLGSNILNDFFPFFWYVADTNLLFQPQNQGKLFLHLLQIFRCLFNLLFR